MNPLKSLGRPVILLALLFAGVGLILHIGYNVVSREEPPVQRSAAVEHEELPVPESAAAEVESAGGETAAPPDPAPPEHVEMQPQPQPDPPEIVATPRGRFIATEPILFNSGASTMRETSYAKLDKIAGFLKRHPEISIEIIGHTDNLGPEPVNQRVSAERAGIVMDYLAAQGIDPSRMRSRGMGSRDPIESNETQLGRQANRRIEFFVDEKAAASR